MARILVVDDEEVVRQFLRDALTSAGHSVMEAKDGEEGLSTFSPGQVDLVICDIMMPRKTGLDVLKQLKADYPDTKIISIAAVGDPMLHTARELGADLTFDKPFLLSEMLAGIEKLLGEG